MELEVVKGDITELDVDVVVNAANASLSGGGGVDGAIHAAAGPRLAEACAELDGCPTGEARATPGFDLPAEHVVHAVGPRWSGGDAGEDQLLASAYRNALQVADDLGATSVAFPAISTGVYGFPEERAARIAVATLREVAPRTGVERILLVGFDEEATETLRGALG